MASAPAVADRRKRAVRSLRELLRDASSPSSVPKGAGGSASTSPSASLGKDSVKGLLGVLTSDELVHLMEWEQVAKAGASAHSWCVE